jgi:TRAP-type mannitol/chloroaromatic compound transport system permease large subunit
MVLRAVAPAPPFGYNLSDIYRSIIPFVFVMLTGLTIVILFPEVALWLPEWHKAR